MLVASHGHYYGAINPDQLVAFLSQASTLHQQLSASGNKAALLVQLQHVQMLRNEFTRLMRQ